MCLGKVFLYEVIKCSLNYISSSFPSLGTFSAIISSNKLSVLFSLCSPSGIPIILMSPSLVELDSSHRVSSFSGLNSLFSTCIISRFLSSSFHMACCLSSSTFFISFIKFFSSIISLLEFQSLFKSITSLH